MTTKLIHVGPNESLKEMHRLFVTLPLHHLLVMEEGRLLGIVSDRDVLKHLSPFTDTQLESKRDRFTANLPAARIMRKDVISVSDSLSLREIAKIMLDNGVELVPVVDDDGKVTGVASWKDLLRFLIN